MQIRLTETPVGEGETSDADLKFMGEILVPPNALLEYAEQARPKSVEIGGSGY